MTNCTVHPTQPTCNVVDTTPPPTPTIRVLIASAGLCIPGTFRPNSTQGVSGAKRDPVYLEVGNWEPGTNLQILDKSNHPDGTWEDSAVMLEPTGHLLENRLASVWIDEEQVEKLNLDAGDSIWVRAVDDAGNVSPYVATFISGQNYGTPGLAQISKDSSAWYSAGQVNVLDGVARKSVVLRYIADTKAPAVQAFERGCKLVTETAPDGKVSVSLVGDGLLEPGATVRIMNGRTGLTSSGTVSGDQKLSIPLVGAANDGDQLFVAVYDAAGNHVGDPYAFELRYGANCKDGRASTQGILGARLAGVIKEPS